MSTAITVIEITHHGDFRHRREVTVDPTSLAQVAAMVYESPYHYSPPYTRIARIAADLEIDGEAEHGWTRWHRKDQA